MEGAKTKSLAAGGATGIAAVLGFLTQFNGLAKNLSEAVENWTNVSSGFQAVLLIVPLLLVVASKIRDRAAPKSRIKRAEILDRRIETPDQLYGRTKDLNRLMKLLASVPMIHVNGESGVGKTTLLIAGLLPNLQASTDYHGIYLDSLGREDWERSPRLALAKALWRSLSAENRTALALEVPIESEDVFTVLLKIRQVLGRTSILILDQFETYLLCHRQRLVSAEKRTWIPWSELIEKNRFWSDVAGLLKKDVLHVVTSVRSTDQAALRPFNPDGTEGFELDRLSRSVLIDTLADFVQQSLVSDPEGGWDGLSSRLIADLSAGGAVLPVRMTVALQGLTSLPHLTARDYQNLGGLRGLETEFILKHAASAARLAGQPASKVLRALVALKTDDVTEPGSLSTPVLVGRSGLDPAAVASVLRHLESHNIVRRRLNPDTDEECWSLYHDYLAHGVADAEGRVERWSVRLRDQAKAHASCGPHLLRRWHTLLPPASQLALLWQWIRGAVRFVGYRRFIALSTLRWLPYVAVLVAWLLAADKGWSVFGGEFVRTRLDSLGVSAFRSIYTDAQISKTARDMLAQLSDELTKRQTLDGWTTTAGDPGAQTGHDYWVHAQALSVQAKAVPAEARALDPLVDRIALMFSPFEVITDANGREVGWPENATIKYARAEPVMWTADALAILYRRLGKGDPQRARVLDYLNRVCHMLAHYYQDESGAWSRFSGSREADQHSTYISSLAVMVMLDLRQAGLKEISGFDEPLDNVLLKTVLWLVNSHDYSSHPPGWKELPSDGTGGSSERKEPLTLFVMSVISRSVTEMPPTFVASIAAPAVQALRDDFKALVVERLLTNQNEETVRLLVPSDVFPKTGATVEPSQEPIKSSIGFLWYPWAVETARRGLKRAPDLGWTSVEIARVRQNLGRLIIAEGERFVSDATNGRTFTYKAAELAYVLDVLATGDVPAPAVR